MDIINEESSQEFSGLYDRIKLNPWENGLWEELASLAKKEEGRSPVTICDKVPLAEILAVGERLNTNGKDPDKLRADYAIFTKDSAVAGLTWYDLVLAPPHEDLLEALKAKIGERDWGNALDLGAGTGKTTGIIVEHAKKVTAIDIVPENVKFLNEKFGDVNVIEGDIGDLDRLGVLSGNIDLLLCNGVIPYIQEEAKIAKLADAIDKVLAPGGSMFLVGPVKSPTEKYFRYEKERMKSAKGLIFALLNERASPVNKANLVNNRLGTAQFAFSFHHKGYKRTEYDFPEKEASVFEFKKPLAF